MGTFGGSYSNPHQQISTQRTDRALLHFGAESLGISVRALQLFRWQGRSSAILGRRICLF